MLTSITTGTPLDKRHTIAVNKVTDIERYGREGRVDENYTAPQIEEFADREVSALF